MASNNKNGLLTIKSFSKDLGGVDLEYENMLMSFNLTPVKNSSALVIAKIVLDSLEKDELFISLGLQKNGETIYGSSKPVYKGENEITIIQSVSVTENKSNVFDVFLSSLYNDRIICKTINVDVIFSGDGVSVYNPDYFAKIVATENNDSVFVGLLKDGKFLYNEISKGCLSGDELLDLDLYDVFGSVDGVDVAYLKNSVGEQEKLIFYCESDKILSFYNIERQIVEFVDSGVDSFSVCEIDHYNSVLVSYIKNGRAYYCLVDVKMGLSKTTMIDFDYSRGVSGMALSRGGVASGLVYLCLTDKNGVNYLLSLIFPVGVEESVSCCLNFGGGVHVYEGA